MQIRSSVIAAGLAALAAYFNPAAAAANEIRNAALDDFVDIDFFDIFPKCDDDKTVAENAPEKDSKYCADMFKTRARIVERFDEMEAYFDAEYNAIDQTKIGFARKMEALEKIKFDKMNEIAAEERVLCHAIQSKYIGKEGITLIIHPEKYVLLPN